MVSVCGKWQACALLSFVICWPHPVLAEGRLAPVILRHLSRVFRDGLSNIPVTRFLFVFLLGISFLFLSITAFSLSSHFDASPNLELSLELLQLPDSRTAALVIF